MKRFKDSIHFPLMLLFIFTSGFFFEAGLSAQTGSADSGTFKVEDVSTQKGKEEKTQDTVTIKVTANKIEEDIKDVPQSITVINEKTLNEKGIKNVPDLIKEIPNVMHSPNHGNAVNFRGLNTSMFTSNNPVVIYIDGIPYSRAYGFDASLVNVERVEVLRGPQGTLYGKDAIGGVISIVTKDPDNEFHGKVGSEYGSFNYMQGLVNLNGPVIKDILYFGINGQYEQDDGWIENEYPGAEENADRKKDRKISGYLLFKPAEKFTARLNVTHDYTKPHWEDCYRLPAGSQVSDFDRDDAEKVSYDIDTANEIVSNAQSLHLGYDFDLLTLTSTTTHRKLETDGIYDADFGDDPDWLGLTQFSKSETDTWTEELRMSSNNRTGFRWVCGAYFDLEEYEQGPYGMEVYYAAYSTTMKQNCESESESNTMAAFGQVMVPLVKGFELTLGARYQRIKKEIDLVMYSEMPLGTSQPSFELEGEKTWNAFLPKAALSFDMTDRWTTYISYSKGYMPGGFNYFASSGTEEDARFEPQVSDNYEFGFKGSYRQFSTAASVFYMDITDIHVYKASGATWVADNADKAHSLGAELELTFLPIDSLELTGAFGVMEAEYDDWDNGAGVKFDGKKIEHSPAHTARAGIAYRHSKGFYARADVRNQGDTYYYNDANKALEKEGSYTILDAKIGYRLMGFDIYAYGKNLANEEYVNGLRSSSMIGAIASFGEPRSFGAGLSYEF